MFCKYFLSLWLAFSCSSWDVLKSKSFSFYESHLFFSFIIITLELKKYFFKVCALRCLSNLRSQTFSPFFQRFYHLALIVRSMIHSEFIFIWCEERMKGHTFPHGYLISPASIVERL